VSWCARALLLLFPSSTIMMCCVAVWLQCMSCIYTYIQIYKEIYIYIYICVFTVFMREGTAAGIWCGVLHCVTVCCSMLQCVAVCCRVLQCVVVCCSRMMWRQWILDRYAAHCQTLQHTATYCNTLQHTTAHVQHFVNLATSSNRMMWLQWMLGRTATHRYTLQHTAIHFTLPQHTCNTLLTARTLSGPNNVTAMKFGNMTIKDSGASALEFGGSRCAYLLTCLVVLFIER